MVRMGADDYQRKIIDLITVRIRPQFVSTFVTKSVSYQFPHVMAKAFDKNKRLVPG